MKLVGMCVFSFCTVDEGLWIHLQTMSVKGQGTARICFCLSKSCFGDI